MKRYFQKHLSDAKVRARSFFILGMLLTLVLASVIAQVSVRSRFSVGAKPPFTPDYATVLPSGAVLTADGAVELQVSTVPTYAVAYTRSGLVWLSLVEWHAQEGRYIAVTSIALPTDRGANVVGVLEEYPGKSVSPALVVFTSGPSAKAQMAFVVTRAGSLLALAQVQGKSGTLVNGFGIGDGLIKNALSFSDVSGTGMRNVIFTPPSYSSASPEGGVYDWKNGILVRDPKLSDALDLSARIFPEPPQTEVANGLPGN